MIFTSAEMMNEIIPEYVGKSKGEPCFYFVKIYSMYYFDILYGS